MPITAEILIRIAGNVPHLQKHYRKVPDCFPFQTNARILPVTMQCLIVNIFIGQIYTARIADFPINYHNFTMVSVVQDNRHERNQLVKSNALNAFLLDKLLIVLWQLQNASEIIINHPDFNALLRFFFQNFQDFSPHRSFAQNKIFQKNEMLRPFQVFQQPLPIGKPVRIIGCVRILPYRRARITVQISAQIRNRQILFGNFIQNILISRHILFRQFFCFPDAVSEPA